VLHEVLLQFACCYRSETAKLASQLVFASIMVIQYVVVKKLGLGRLVGIDDLVTVVEGTFQRVRTLN